LLKKGRKDEWGGPLNSTQMGTCLPLPTGSPAAEFRPRTPCLERGPKCQKTVHLPRRPDKQTGGQNFAASQSVLEGRWAPKKDLSHIRAIGAHGGNHGGPRNGRGFPGIKAGRQRNALSTRTKPRVLTIEQKTGWGGGWKKGNQGPHGSDKRVNA